MATGIRIGWRKLTMLAAVQIAAPTTTMRRTTKQAVSAAHIVLRCHGVGYSFMLDGQTLNSQRPAFQSPRTVGSPSSNVDVGYLPCSGAEDASLLDVRRWSGSLRRFCFSDPVPAPSAMIPMPPEHDSISNKCRRYVRRSQGRRVRSLLQRESDCQALDQI